MTKLAHQLGVPTSYKFHDLYSFEDPDLISLVPRPANAILFIYPFHHEASDHRDSEISQQAEYNGKGPNEPVLFFRQSIIHACGLFGLIHCITNGEAADHIDPDSALAQLVSQAIPLGPPERAQLIHDSDFLEKAHAAAAQSGQSTAPPLGEDPGHAFIAFVKGKDGKLYELDGGRKGPVMLGQLSDDEDVLCEKALELGPRPYLKRENLGFGVLNFSATVMAANE